MRVCVCVCVCVCCVRVCACVRVCLLACLPVGLLSCLSCLSACDLCAHMLVLYFASIHCLLIQYNTTTQRYDTTPRSVRACVVCNTYVSSNRCSVKAEGVDGSCKEFIKACVVQWARDAIVEQPCLNAKRVEHVSTRQLLHHLLAIHLFQANWALFKACTVAVAVAVIYGHRCLFV